MVSWAIRYGVHFVPTMGRRHAELLTFQFLSMFWRQEDRRLEMEEGRRGFHQGIGRGGSGGRYGEFENANLQTAKKCVQSAHSGAVAFRGWLGPATPQEVNAAVHSEQPYLCHIEINKAVKKGLSEKQIEEKTQHCVGMARYQNSVL